MLGSCWTSLYCCCHRCLPLLSQFQSLVGGATYHLMKNGSSSTSPPGSVSPTEMVKKVESAKDQALLILAQSVERLTKQIERIFDMVVGGQDKEREERLMETVNKLLDTIDNLTRFKEKNFLD